MCALNVTGIRCCRVENHSVGDAKELFSRRCICSTTTSAYKMYFEINNKNIAPINGCHPISLVLHIFRFVANVLTRRSRNLLVACPMPSSVLVSFMHYLQ